MLCLAPTPPPQVPTESCLGGWASSAPIAHSGDWAALHRQERLNTESPSCLGYLWLCSFHACLLLQFRKHSANRSVLQLTPVGSGPSFFPGSQFPWRWGMVPGRRILSSWRNTDSSALCTRGALGCWIAEGFSVGREFEVSQSYVKMVRSEGGAEKYAWGSQHLSSTSSVCGKELKSWNPGATCLWQPLERKGDACHTDISRRVILESIFVSVWRGRMLYESRCFCRRLSGLWHCSYELLQTTEIRKQE